MQWIKIVCELHYEKQPKNSLVIYLLQPFNQSTESIDGRFLFILSVNIKDSFF